MVPHALSTELLSIDRGHKELEGDASRKALPTAIRGFLLHTLLNALCAGYGRDTGIVGFASETEGDLLPQVAGNDLRVGKTGGYFQNLRVCRHRVANEAPYGINRAQPVLDGLDS